MFINLEREVLEHMLQVLKEEVGELDTARTISIQVDYIDDLIPKIISAVFGTREYFYSPTLSHHHLTVHTDEFYEHRVKRTCLRLRDHKPIEDDECDATESDIY